MERPAAETDFELLLGGMFILLMILFLSLFS